MLAMRRKKYQLDFTAGITVIAVAAFRALGVHPGKNCCAELSNPGHVVL